MEPKDNPIQREELAQQKVEHENLVHTTTVHIKTAYGRKKWHVIIDGKRHNAYPTGNPHEPWTTNLARSR